MDEELASMGRVQKQSGSYTFRIEGYSGLTASVGVSTESPEFRLCGHLWQLRIFPGGSLEAHKNFVSYYLASKSARQARASYKLSVMSQINGGTDETFCSSGVRLFEAKGTQIDGWGRDRFILLTSLKDQNMGFYLNDTVIFKVSIVVYGSLETADIPLTGSRNMNSTDITLSDCMHAMLAEAKMDQTTADLVILAGESRTPMYCHRCVLKARSPVFHAMLTAPGASPLSSHQQRHYQRQYNGIAAASATASSSDGDLFRTCPSVSPGSTTPPPPPYPYPVESDVPPSPAACAGAGAAITVSATCGTPSRYLPNYGSNSNSNSNSNSSAAVVCCTPPTLFGTGCGGGGMRKGMAVSVRVSAPGLGSERGQPMYPTYHGSGSGSGSGEEAEETKDDDDYAYGSGQKHTLLQKQQQPLPSLIRETAGHHSSSSISSSSSSSSCCFPQQPQYHHHHYHPRFEEEGEGVVPVPDVEPETMHELLVFMYTDSLSSAGSTLETLAVPLLVAAAKYQVVR
jgi:hypothetical protein